MISITLAVSFAIYGVLKKLMHLEAEVGIATAIPLLLFAKSTKMIKLSTVGFLKYISPTISFLLGITVFHEHISLTELGSFVIIWLAIILFILSERKI